MRIARTGAHWQHIPGIRITVVNGLKGFPKAINCACPIWYDGN
jgi:hypothetical protein